MKKLVRRIYRKYVPAKTRDTIERYAKGFVAGSAALLQAVNLLAPMYDDEAKTIVAYVIAVLTVVGVVRVPNRPQTRRRR